MHAVLSQVKQSWACLLVAGAVALSGCGGLEAPTDAEGEASTHSAAEYAEGDCDGPNDCVVYGPYVDCGPGLPMAYAWRTNDGGYCMERNACGPNGLSCPAW